MPGKFFMYFIENTLMMISINIWSLGSNCFYARYKNLGNW
jgi:hypothetical protein